MRVGLLSCLFVLAGCASSAVPAVTVGTTQVIEEPPPPPPPILVEDAEIESITPLTPQPTPRHRIVRRSVFEQARVAEWTLANGLTVVYHWDSQKTGYHVVVRGQDLDSIRADASRTVDGGLTVTAGPGVRLARGDAESLGALVASVGALFSRTRAEAFAPPSASLLVVSGPLEWEWVESTLAGLAEAGSDQGASPTLDRASWQPAWDDVPALRIAAEIVAVRADDPEAGERLRAGGPLAVTGDSSLALRLFAPVPSEAFESARQAAERQARAPAGTLDALLDLYAAPGRHRPPQPPSRAFDVPRRIASTTRAGVDALLARFASDVANG